MKQLGHYLWTLLRTVLQIFGGALFIVVVAVVVDALLWQTISNDLASLLSLSVATLLCLFLITPIVWNTFGELTQILSRSERTDPSDPHDPPQTSSEPPSEETRDKQAGFDFNTVFRRYARACVASTVAFSLIYLLFDAEATNVIPEFGAAFQLLADTALTFPSVLLQDEIAHYFYARDLVVGLVERDPEQVIRLAIDEWGRPGNTLTYALPSFFGMEWRRWWSVILLILTSAETIMISLALGRHGDQKPPFIYAVFSHTVVPALLWLQPWFFYFGSQSLSQIPFMYFLTAAVAAWLHGRYGRATFFFSLLPLTRHEALPLLLLWGLYLYRKPLIIWLRDRYREIFTRASATAPRRVSRNRDDADKTMTKEPLRHKGRYIFALFLPYAIWNIIAFMYSNDAPFRTIFTSEGLAAYQPQDFSVFFIALQTWTGPLVFMLFIGAVIIGGMISYTQYRHWQQHITYDESREAFFEFLVKEDCQAKDGKPTPTPPAISRYTWWLFYALYFVIHVAIITLPTNPFASGGYDFFILPIAPAVAIIASHFFTWLWQVHTAENEKSQGDAAPALSYFREAENFWQSPFSQLAARRRTHIIVVALTWILLLAPSLDRLPPLQADTALTQIYNAVRPLTLAGWLSNDDNPNLSQFIIERRTFSNHIEATQAVVTYIKDNVASDDLNPPFVITTNPALRYALENSDVSGFRLCPQHLWDVQPNVPLYPNLLPTGSTIALDGFPGSAIPTDYMVTNTDIDDSYRLTAHHLTTALNEDKYGAFFGNWGTTPAQFGILDDQEDPTTDPSNNYGYLLYTQGEDLPDTPTTIPKTARQDYAERYCGYDADDRFVEVTVHYQPIYEELNSRFFERRDTNDTLPITRDNLLPLVGCPTLQSVTDIEECLTTLVDIDYIADEEGDLQAINLPNVDTALYVPPGSYMPVLECESVGNRLEARWCLVVFADTAFAIDTQTELSYTANTLASANTDSETVCDYTRGSTDTLSELRILPDVRNMPRIRSIDKLELEDVEQIGRERADGVFVVDEALLYGDYGDYDPRGLEQPDATDPAEQVDDEAKIFAPGCVGWVLVNNRGNLANPSVGNTVLDSDDPATRDEP